MEHIVGALGGSVPALVAGQVGRMDAEAIARIDDPGDAGPDLGLASQIPNRRANRIALLQKADHAPRADIPRTPGHQHRPAFRHFPFPAILTLIRWGLALHKPRGSEIDSQTFGP